jgi:hypothetical protein
MVTYLRFARVILPLDVDNFEKICVVIYLGDKRLLWKPMGNDLAYSSLYWINRTTPDNQTVTQNTPNDYVGLVESTH